jgi:hypothetical protein
MSAERSRGRGGAAGTRRSREAMSMASTALALASFAALALQASPAVASTLPDGRAYELVSRVGEVGGESALDGATPFFMGSSSSGEAAYWEALGSCCGASSGGLNTYEAVRGADGWHSQSITPTPAQPLSGLEVQEAVFWSEDLSDTIFSTPESYAAGDHRPLGSGGSDLYLRGPDGTLTWLSQGPLGSGSEPYPSVFDAATRDALEVVFTTVEPLTANAVGLSGQAGSQYLYVRDAQSETTSLVDVDDSGEPISPYGASLGDEGPPPEGFFSTGYRGSATHAISEDGTKIFFETPPPGLKEAPEGTEPHLYMRDLASGLTTPLDDPSASGYAHFQGASADGSLVFFTSDEGLDGAPATNELYELDTTSHAIGSLPPMTPVPIGGGAGMLGVTAISNDDSHVFFVADGVLAGNANSAHAVAQPGQPNLYGYETATGKTSFIATLLATDVSNCKPTCASGEPAGLVATADIFRRAYPTPDGSVLVFTSGASLTGEAHAPSTTLTSYAEANVGVVEVASTAGFRVGETILLGSGEQQEIDGVESIDGPNEMTIFTYGAYGPAEAREVGTTVTAVQSQVYRYATGDGSLTCISCTAPGVQSTEGATLGEVGGGTYAPPRYAAQASADGSRIFFDSPDPLAPGAPEAEFEKQGTEPTNVYEWEGGKVYLIASAAEGGSTFDGTTPSGGDVFFSTRRQLVPGAIAGDKHIYDARVGGGFPEAPATRSQCETEACRSAVAVATFSEIPASAELGEPEAASIVQPALAHFTVSKLTAAQRAELARTGRLRLAVSATAPGALRASVTAKLDGRWAHVAQARGSLRGAGTLVLTLRLGAVARAALARHRTLRLRIEVTYSATGARDLAELTLTQPGNARTTVRGLARHA